MRLREWQKNLLLGLGATGLTLVALEGVLRVAWQPDSQHTVIRADPFYGWALRPHAAMHSAASDRGLDYHIQINALGLRDRERTASPAPGTHRVLFVGDSIVFGTGVEFHDRCTERLEGALGPGVEVLNAGVSGWGTDQEFLWLTHEGLALHPDVVVLGFCMLNDVLNVMLPHELFGTAPKPRFVLDGGRLRLVPAARREPTAQERAEGFFKHSRLLHFSGRHLRLLRMRLQTHAPVADPEAVPYFPENLESDSSHWSVFRVPYTQRFESAFQVTEALIQAMRDSCAARQIPFVLFAFPNKVEVDAQARTRELEHYGYDARQFDLAAPYDRMRALADRMGSPFVYPRAEFEAAGEPLFFARDGHPNAAGHAVAASALAPVLREELERATGAWHATRK